MKNLNKKMKNNYVFLLRQNELINGWVLDKENVNIDCMKKSFVINLSNKNIEKELKDKINNVILGKE